MTCNCPAPGICETFGKVQSERHWQICRGEVLTPQKCEAYRVNWANLRDNGRPKPGERPILSDAEVAELLPDLSDPTLIGNRIAALTTAIGIPPCAGCETRKTWMNKAHAWLRG